MLLQTNLSINKQRLHKWLVEKERNTTTEQIIKYFPIYCKLAFLTVLRNFRFKRMNYRLPLLRIFFISALVKSVTSQRLIVCEETRREFFFRVLNLFLTVAVLT